MAQTIRKRRRTARRHATPFDPGLELAPLQGQLTWGLCHPEAPELGPTYRTTLRRSLWYPGMADVEIRGFPGEEVKFVRNVATQYHVRIGCENIAHTRGKFELMRVLQRWDLSSLPAGTQVRSVELQLHQEDHSSRRHYWPLHWPVTLYLYAVKKAWKPGRGGLNHDNLSPPQPGDAWWMEARTGEEAWGEPGCGYGHDEDPHADREAQPLAAAALTSPRDPLVFSGPRLVAHTQNAIERGEPLSFLLKASDEHELIPGSLRSFYSAEFGEDEIAHRRPTLEISWQAPTLQTEQRPFVLEPACRALVVPAATPQVPGPYTLHAGFEFDSGPTKDDADLRLSAASREITSPNMVTPSIITPEIHVRGWLQRDDTQHRGNLTQPIVGRPRADFAIELSTAIRFVPAGEPFEATLLQTWVPSDTDEDDTFVCPFVFRSPSGRSLSAKATTVGNHRYRCRFLPDELGVWIYRWQARPDRRLPRQEDGGMFTVLPPPGDAGDVALAAFIQRAAEDLEASGSLLDRRRIHYRLTAIERELYRRAGSARRSGAIDVAPRCQDMIYQVRELLPKVR